MIRRVAYHQQNQEGKWVEAPLDDADPWTIDFANQVNGRDLTDEEFELLARLFSMVVS